MDDNRVALILGNVKMSMEMEGFEIDEELEEIGRQILVGEINAYAYKEQVRREALRYANEV